MSDRKSGRARKAVDYTKFGEDDLDDDFADSTPPASKKPRLSNKENKEKKSSKKVTKENNNVKQKSASRKSVEERRYERELQEALELSMSQSDPSQETRTATPDHNIGQIEVPPVIDDMNQTEAPQLINDKNQNEAPPIIIQDDERDAPSPVLPVQGLPPVLPRMSKCDDEIEVLETGIETVPSSRRGASKRKKYIESDSDSGGEDSDFAPEDDDDSFDDDDDEEDDYNPEDSDSDFGSSKKKKSVKKPAVKTTKASAKSIKETTGTSKTSGPKSAKITKSVANSKTGITHKPLATSSPASNRAPSSGLAANKSSNWKPPGIAGKSPSVLNTKANDSLTSKSPISVNNKTRPPISGSIGKSPLGGVNIKSPSSGLRIGLSRNMKLKPLHPNLKIQN